MGEAAGDMPLSDEEVADYVLDLQNDFKRILLSDFRVQTVEVRLDDNAIENLTLNVLVISDIVHSAEQAMHDLRNSYPHTISMLKYISNVCYWIIRLKPVNCNFLMRDNTRITDIRINEKLALYWGLFQILKCIKDSKLVELVEGTPENMQKFCSVVLFFLETNLYSTVTDRGELADTSKYKETVHYSRYKKVTAINIYEMFMHLIVTLRFASLPAHIPVKA
jgi:hypothetical protein